MRTKSVGVDAHLDPNREAADGAHDQHGTIMVVPARGTMWASSPTKTNAKRNGTQAVPDGKKLKLIDQRGSL